MSLGGLRATASELKNHWLSPSRQEVRELASAGTLRDADPARCGPPPLSGQPRAKGEEGRGQMARCSRALSREVWSRSGGEQVYANEVIREPFKGVRELGK